MRLNPSRSLTTSMKLLTGVIVLIATSWFLSIGVTWSRKAAHQKIEGFDYRPLFEQHPLETGPPIGQQIDISRLKSRDGRSLLEVSENRPVMLVVVDPDCGLCGVAADQMRWVRDGISGVQLPYYMVSFTAQLHSADFFNYAKSFDLRTESFLWSNDLPPPSSFSSMVVPSHLLLGPGGVLINKWPGSHGDLSVRHRMANQIIADTLTRH